MRSKFASACCLVGLASLPAQGVVNQSLLRAPETRASAQGVAAIVEGAQAALVHVFVDVDGPRGRFKIERPSSGVIVDPDGLVVTWSHLVVEAEGASDKSLVVQLNDAHDSRLAASIVRRDPATGLALLRVAPPEGGLTALSLGPDAPRAGERIVVLARPEGKEMLAFSGVASPALAPTRHRGVDFAAGDVFLCDSRQDVRCDGAPVLSAAGALLGIYGTDNVKKNKSEPTLDELRQPSFGIVASAGTIRRAFRSEFAGHPGLAEAPPSTASVSADAAAAVARGVVSVWAGDGDWPALGPDDPGAFQRRERLGSGVVLSASGLVVTNRHLVAGATPRIRTADGRTYRAEVVRDQAASNLALLRVALPAGRALQVAEFAPDADPILGEVVLAIGRPTGGAFVVSAGVVSALRGREGGRVQADADLGPPNAGGAIADLSGRVIGIGDGGAVDPIEVAFRMRGDRISTQTNLSTFVGLRAVRRLFGREIAAEAGEAESIRSPASPSAAAMARRRSPLTAMIPRVSGAMLNIYIAKNLAVPTEEQKAFGIVPDPVLRTLSLGSGVVIDPSGLALSNWHVVDAATNPDGSMREDHVVTARVFGGRTYPVEVLSISRENDLSLLRLKLPPGETLTAVELGNSDLLRIGEAVAAIGNPHGRDNTITYGVVSKKGHYMRVKGRWAKLGPVLETDAAINGGNSGGALLDMQGRLAGINSAGGGTFNNVGYAIEVNHVREVVLTLLLSAYKLRSANLGLEVLDDEGKVLVMSVDERGPAAAAGVLSGDRVVSLAGTEITWSPGFAMTLLEQKPGVELELVVERDGKRMVMRVTPLPPAQWSVLMQSNLLLRPFPFAEDPERVRAACIALHRHRTGDPTAEPPVIRPDYVSVEEVHALPSFPPIEVEPGDLLLALEMRDAESGRPVYIDIESVEQLRDLFNDMFFGKAEGVDYYKEPAEYACWIARGAELKRVALRAKRLLW